MPHTRHFATIVRNEGNILANILRDAPWNMWIKFVTFDFVNMIFNLIALVDKFKLRESKF